MSVVLEARGLVKKYPKATANAVDGISLTVREGSCFGLLGPNGAGKTTTVEMLEGILKPDAGEILYRGEPIGRAFREKTGIQFQDTALQDHLTVRELLNLFGALYPSRLSEAELTKLCDLSELLDREPDKLSGGQRQRALLALALVNDPDIVFLDEPTTGLDPQARRNFWDLARSIKARGKTILLTTHYMEEAYALCDEVAIVDKGRIIAQGAPDTLLKKHFDGVVIELEGTEIMTNDVEGSLDELRRKGRSLAHLRVRPRTLEDLFLALTGRELRE